VDNALECREVMQNIESEDADNVNNALNWNELLRISIFFNFVQ
jgi:hypothetical protein